MTKVSFSCIINMNRLTCQKGVDPGKLAHQLIVDLYGCDAALLNDAALVQRAAHEAVASLGAEIVEECVHAFEPIGVSYIAVITTSHFSIHTWPEFGYAAVDVFSCAEEIPAQLTSRLAAQFQAKTQTVRQLERDLKGGGQT